MADRQRRKPTGLGPDAVIDAALEVLDQVGVSGFSMRVVADYLDTYPATLYWHVGGRGALMSAVIDRVLAEIVVPDLDAMAWDEWLRELAIEYRRALHRHPNVGQLVALELSAGAAATQLVELILEALESAGFHGPRLAAAHNFYVGSVTGWVSVELSSPPADAGIDWEETFEASVSALDATRFPALLRNFDNVAGKVIGLRWHSGAEFPLDDAFQAALGAWITGLKYGFS